MVTAHIPSMGVLYAAAVAGAGVMGIWHAELIKGNEPIRHGRWWSIWAATALLAAFLMLRSPWALVAAIGMLCIFSTWFRAMLNMMRDKPWDYMGPEPSGSSTFVNALFSDLHNRSWYDLLCWVVFKRTKCRPVLVALTLEAAGAILAYHFVP